MRHTYRFRNTPELADTAVTVENVGDRIVIAPDLSAPPPLSALIRTYFDSFNAMTPIATHCGANVYSLYWPPVPGQPHARFFEDFVRTWFLKRPSPPVATVAVTGDCQCRCVHCSAAPLSGTTAPYSLAELKRIIDECLSIGVCNIIFLGGEPLLRKDLEACIAHVDPALAVTQIFTNAVALGGQRIASLRASGLNAVKISLDSPDPEEHDRLRGRAGTYRSVERGAKLALDAGLLVGLATYATNESIARGDLARIAERAARWGVHEVTVFDVIPTGRLLNREEVMLTPESRSELLVQAERLNRNLFPAPRILTQSWTNSESRFAKYIGCLAATSQFHITAAGDLTPCDFTPLSFGNVRSEPIDRIWKRLTEHPEFCRHSQRCRMQDPGFRAKFIETPPAGAGLPCPLG